jgi:hypothetical protein
LQNITAQNQGYAMLAYINSGLSGNNYFLINSYFNIRTSSSEQISGNFYYIDKSYYSNPGVHDFADGDTLSLNSSLPENLNSFLLVFEYPINFGLFLTLSQQMGSPGKDYLFSIPELSGGFCF